MEINNSNINDLAGNIADRLLIAMEMGTLPIGGKGRRVIWEEFVAMELKHWIENDNPQEGKLEMPEIGRVN